MPPLLLEEVTNGQAGLAGADDDYVKWEPVSSDRAWESDTPFAFPLSAR
jgi:hypothetical protein